MERPVRFELTTICLEGKRSSAELQPRSGGPGRHRTDDISLAGRVLSRLSYEPGVCLGALVRNRTPILAVRRACSAIELRGRIRPSLFGCWSGCSDSN